MFTGSILGRLAASVGVCALTSAGLAARAETLVTAGVAATRFQEFETAALDPSGGPAWWAHSPTGDRKEPATLRANVFPPLAVLEAQGAVIDEITIDNGDIFDPEKPGEGGWLYRTANKIHINTRPAVIRRLLLFKSGEPVSEQKIRESERLIRSTGYLYDAEIRVTGYDGEQVNLVVETRDVWTLSGGVGFRREGGENSLSLGLEDGNFLGWGKDVTIDWSKNVDRTSMRYRYRDPNVAGSRVRMMLAYADNSDGQAWGADVEQPFYSLDTRWAAGASAGSATRLDRLWQLGTVFDEFNNEETLIEVYGGLSKGLIRGRAGRWKTGFTYQENLFTPVPESLGMRAPDDRTLAFPWVEYESVQDRFVELNNLNRLNRTEDVNLGRRYRLRLGYSAQAFGATTDQAIFYGLYQQGSAPAAGQMLIFNALADGRWGSTGGENIRVGGQVRYSARNLGRHLFFAAFQADFAYNLDPEKQLLLGGETGLRGYPLRYQAGDRRVHLTVEQRFYTPWHIFKLVHVGAAVFLDAGSAWFADVDAPGEQGLLTNVGAGLRLGSSRSSAGALVHIDVAVPLVGTDDIDSVQFYIRSKESF